MLAPPRGHLDGADTPLHPEALDAGRVAQQPSDLGGKQLDTAAWLVQGLQAAPQAVAGEQTGVIESAQALDGQLRVLIGVHVQGAETLEDLLGDRAHQRLAPTSATFATIIGGGSRLSTAAVPEAHSRDNGPGSVLVGYDLLLAPT